MFTLMPGPPVRTEIVEKRSRFITTLSRAESEDDARLLVNAVRSEFPDARHHCSAFVIASDEGPPRTHSSDDGEPSGTAGAPILEVLTGAGLENVVAVVTRYFGGVLLGTGGLVRAYSLATQTALDLASVAERVVLELVRVSVPAEFAGRFTSEVHQRDWLLRDQSWGDSLTLTLALSGPQIQEAEELLASMTRSPSTLQRIGKTTIDIAR